MGAGADKQLYLDHLHLPLVIFITLSNDAQQELQADRTIIISLRMLE